VERSNLEWLIVRPAGVYGPGDEVISTILKLVRALPAIPVIDDGEQRFQPIWFEDLGRAIATLVDRRERFRVIELAGSEITTLNDLLRRFSAITGRKPLKVAVPMPLASLATRVASLAVDLPIDQVKLTMLQEENVLSDPNARPLADLGIEETPLDKGLRILADSIPEQLPEEGVGSMEHKRFWAEIAGSRYSAARLMAHFRDHVNDVMPIEFAAEPHAPTRIEAGVTMTGHIPGRGNIQIRVEKAQPTHVVFATIEGHPIAGIVEFTTHDTATGVRFAIDVFARAANLFDLIALRTVGNTAQAANWRTVVQRMIDVSGGTSDGVHTEKEMLSEEDAAQIEKNVRALVHERQRGESDAAERPA
jgi:NADH dehydrogenase